jgi:hypothetical protein|tara:strand:- start:784 stop:1176 length:393 start_codon:yes stop_codon:yes gene_type:complete
MKLFYNNKGFVDFEAPIFLDDEVFKKFCEGLSHIIDEEINIKEITEKHKVMKDVKREMRKWSEDELFELLSPASNGELMIKLNRSAMSIHMRRGEFVPSFMSWAISKGYDSSKITPSIVKQFQEKKDEDS